MSLRVGVTGAYGFIGSRLVAELENCNFEVVVVDFRAEKLDRHTSLDVLVHLAAVTPQKVDGDERLISQLNLEATRSALEVCKYSSCPMVFISSYLYSYLNGVGVEECSELELNSEYKRSKRLCEIECEKHYESTNIPVTVLRLTNVYGPKQGSQFLIPALIEQALCGGPVVLRSRSTRRDFLYVDDAVAAIKLSLSCSGGFQYFNVGSGQITSIEEIIDLIEAKVGFSLRRVWGKSDGGGDSSPMITDKILTCLGWTPQVNLETGISRTIDEFSFRQRNF